MKFMDIIHWSWCLPQTLLGYLMLKKYKRMGWVNDIIEYRLGTVLIRQIALGGGRSLGKYVFTYDYKDSKRSEELKTKAQKRMDRHEYGHALQSLLLGPLYLFIIGGPSILWHKHFDKVKNKVDIDYYKDFYTERWADKWGKVER